MSPGREKVRTTCAASDLSTVSVDNLVCKSTLLPASPVTTRLPAGAHILSSLPALSNVPSRNRLLTASALDGASAIRVAPCQATPRPIPWTGNVHAAIVARRTWDAERFAWLRCRQIRRVATSDALRSRACHVAPSPPDHACMALAVPGGARPSTPRVSFSTDCRAFYRGRGQQRQRPTFPVTEQCAATVFRRPTSVHAAAARTGGTSASRRHRQLQRPLSRCSYARVCQHTARFCRFVRARPEPQDDRRLNE